MTDEDVESAEDEALRHIMVADYVQSQRFKDDVAALIDKGYPREAAEDMAIFEYQIDEELL